MFFTHAGHETAYANAVAAHDGIYTVAFFVIIGHPHGFGVPAAQLEDVAHLNAVLDHQGVLAAFGANAARYGFGRIHISGAGHIPIHIQAGVMIAFLVGAADQIPCAFQRTVIDYGDIFGQSHGANGSGYQTDMIDLYSRVHFRLEVIAQFGFVDLQIPADKDQYIGIIGIALVYYGLAAFFGGAVEETANLFDGLVFVSGNLLQRRCLPAAVVMYDAFRSLHVGPVAAFGAKNDGILADIRQQHELVADFTPHHAGVGGYGYHLGDACPGINALIRPVAAFIIPLQILLGGVEGISVLHGKFPHPDQSAPSPGLIAEFSLDLINHKRILLVGSGYVHGHMHGGFLMGHAQYHVCAASVFKAQQFLAYAFPTAGGLPETGGHGYGEENLLSVDAVHLLTENRFYFILDALGGRKQRIDAIAYLFDISAAGHQVLALDIRDPVLIPFAQKLTDFHSCVPFL